LKRKAESAMKRSRHASEISGQTEHDYGECRYATKKTWPWKRRIIYKAEVVRAANKEAKDNPRFVVTNLIWNDLSTRNSVLSFFFHSCSSQEAAQVAVGEAITTIDHSDIRGSEPHNRDPSGAASD